MAGSEISLLSELPIFPILLTLGLLPKPWLRRWLAKPTEPGLDEMIADPIFRRLLASDGVGLDQFRALAGRVGASLKETRGRSAAAA